MGDFLFLGGWALCLVLGFSSCVVVSLGWSVWKLSVLVSALLLCMMLCVMVCVASTIIVLCGAFFVCGSVAEERNGSVYGIGEYLQYMFACVVVISGVWSMYWSEVWSVYRLSLWVLRSALRRVVRCHFESAVSSGGA